MLKEKTVTFGELEKRLLGLGFTHSAVADSHHVFKHSLSDTVIALPNYSENEQVRPVHLVAVDKFLTEKGLGTFSSTIETNQNSRKPSSSRDEVLREREVAKPFASRSFTHLQMQEGSPLTNQALLRKVKELGSLTRTEKARVCGYYTVTKNGSERVSMTKFLNALIAAEGIELDGKAKNGNKRGGDRSKDRISVQSNGNLLISSKHTKRMNLKPGDEFEVSLGHKHIYLKQVN